MPRFDVHINPGPRRDQVPYLVSVQSASSDRYRRRLVVPLARISALPPGNQRLGMCWIYSIGPRPNGELVRARKGISIYFHRADLNYF